MRIDASATNLGSIASRPDSSGGSGGTPAQQAYRRALERLTEAQKQLAQDVMSGAPDEVIEADRLRVEAATAALAAAAAALAREQTEAARQERSESSSGRTPDEGDLDVYA